ncbi:MAG TPA: dTDP-4-dehydrorhamnose reductase [Longimicrobium sp.]|jgi:dTDP-4-dehydrorhamnose reductase
MSRPEILLLGRNGQVGWELERALAPLGRVTALGRGEADLTSPDRLREVVRSRRPSVIVNAAAYTAVDQAEGEPEAAFAANATAPGILAEEAKRLGALLVHYSTDYVFDGGAARPYREDDAPGPLNVYGRSKLEGERAIQAATDDHLILRTSWVYGTRGRNFLLTILRLLAERDELRIVADQVGAPTWSRMIAAATAAVLARHTGASRPVGVFHLTAAGQTTWHGFATAIRDRAGGSAAGKPVRPIASSEYPVPAARPRWSVLDGARLEAAFGVELPSWDASLALALAETGGLRS